ncbi:ABC transporter [Alkalihalophilus pseudofirmus]|nr:ABC transporter [Alkalihalophilus pseudofirmus]
MKRLLLLVVSFVLLITLAACGESATTTGSEPETEPQDDAETTEVIEEEPTQLVFEHLLGETTVDVNPEKVVVFDFGVLDSLDKLGVEVTGVPQVNIPPYLSKYEDGEYENVGSLKELDFEKIAEINPDLIIISGRQQEAYEELSKIAPTLYMALDTSNYMESFEENMTRLGLIFGIEQEVEAELTVIKDAIAELHEKVTATDSNGLVVLANQGNISAYGAGSRFGIIHDEFGLTPVDENIDVSTHGMNVSFEYIVEQDPDYLLVVDRDQVVAEEAAAQQTIENVLVQSTKAYQNGNIIYLDPNYWYLSGGGLVSVSEMVKAIDEVIQ